MMMSVFVVRGYDAVSVVTEESWEVGLSLKAGGNTVTQMFWKETWRMWMTDLLCMLVV